MPELTNDQFEMLLKSINSNLTQLSLTNKKEDMALKECDDYLKGNINDVRSMNPFSVYFVISKLPEDKQIIFLQENIDYIREQDEEIFLYRFLGPNSLSYFFSLKVIKALKDIDDEIFKKVLSQNSIGLFHGFTHEDYIDFYKDFYNELLESNNRNFIDGLSFHNRCCYEDMYIEDINIKAVQQKVYNKEFIELLLEKYKNKINKFNSNELLTFLNNIDDIDQYKRFINEHYDSINNAFANYEEYYLNDYLSETDEEKQEILLCNFLENIIIKHDLKKILSYLRPNIIVALYNKNKELFKSLTLSDWILYCSIKNIFNEDFKKIIDTYNVNDIEELFNINLYKFNNYSKLPLLALKYVELKYRSNIVTNGNIDKIDSNTLIFSEKYIKNLSELKEKFHNHTITKNDENYKQYLANFIMFLKNQNIIIDVTDDNFREIEKLFYTIVMGKSMAILFELSCIEDIAMIERLGKIEFKAYGFTVEQLNNYNVKDHRKLCQKYEKQGTYYSSYKQLILKLMLLVGFHNTEVILSIDDSIATLEHLVGNVDVKHIKMDKQGNPVLNRKIMNLLFDDKNYNKIRTMLENKDNDLYKYFPRIFNEWDMIVLNNKDKSLKTILDYLKSDEIVLPPKYYRLDGLFKIIGCKNNIVNETLKLHDQMLNRVCSTIPRITGIKNNYSYEILKLDDMEVLSIGNQTDCCFTVLGNGYSCLKHALLSNNGRILVIKKDNELLAHSWLWRNGNLLCLDNIEIAKKIKEVDFLEIYKQFAEDIIRTSCQLEGISNCIKNVTIGVTNFDKEIKGIKEYPCLITRSCDLSSGNYDGRLGSNRIFLDKLPQPIEKVEYTDSKNVQYLIKGNYPFTYGQGLYYYQDERSSVFYYSKNNIYDENYINQMNKIINALRYIKAEENNAIDKFKMIDITDYDEVYCNVDWFIIYDSENYEEYIKSNDSRAKEEMKLNKRVKIKKYPSK